MAMPLALDAAAHRAFKNMASDLARVFDARFLALVASGARSSIAFVTTIASRDLEALGPLAETWRSEGLDTPLVLTPTEFRRSLDTFPLEYGAVLMRHEVIAGVPPFSDITIHARHIRRACEVLAKAHLLHLRQGWIESDGHEAALASLLVASAEPLRALLLHVSQLHDHGGPKSDAALDGARLAGLDEALVSDLFALDREPARVKALLHRMPDYLALAERLWVFVDQWES
jgi:hypothetical protein